MISDERLLESTALKNLQHVSEAQEESACDIIGSAAQQTSRTTSGSLRRRRP
jgi:hypothetical protein